MNIMSKVKQVIELANQDIIAQLIRIKNMKIINAMNVFCNSEFSIKLYDESTGLYRESTKYLYGLLGSEFDNVRFIQMGH